MRTLKSFLTKSSPRRRLRCSLRGFMKRRCRNFKRALENHIAQTNPLTDAPSVRLCRFALLELKDMADFGAKCAAALIDFTKAEEMRSWLELLDDCLAAAGRVGRFRRAEW